MRNNARRGDRGQRSVTGVPTSCVFDDTHPSTARYIPKRIADPSLHIPPPPPFSGRSCGRKAAPAAAGGIAAQWEAYLPSTRRQAKGRYPSCERANAEGVVPGAGAVWPAAAPLSPLGAVCRPFRRRGRPALTCLGHARRTRPHQVRPGGSRELRKKGVKGKGSQRGRSVGLFSWRWKGIGGNRSVLFVFVCLFLFDC